MELIIGALAVYKVVQLLDLLTPKEAMPWVKVVFTLVLSYAVVLILWTNNPWMDGLAVATLAGATHAIIRMFLLMGDMARHKSVR